MSQKLQLSPQKIQQFLPGTPVYGVMNLPRRASGLIVSNLVHPLVAEVVSSILVKSRIFYSVFGSGKRENVLDLHRDKKIERPEPGREGNILRGYRH